jgi:hypothetical protein
MTNLNILGRRPLLQGLIPASASASAKPLSLDPNKPSDLALIFRKLCFSLDDKVGYWWLQGTRYGLVDTKLVPFWRINIGYLFTVRDISPDSYHVTTLGATFYTDLTTGAYLREFVNPLTQKTIAMPAARPAPFTLKYNALGLEETAAETVNDLRRWGGFPPVPSPDADEKAAGLVRSGAIGPAWIQGDDVWVQSDHLSRIAPPAPRRRDLRANDLVTYFGSLRDVADPAVNMAPAGLAFSDVNVWPAWLEMGDAPGDYYSRTYGRKAFSHAEMPEVWRRLLAQEYPEVAKDPVALLRG